MDFTRQQIIEAFPKEPWEHQLRGVVELFEKLKTCDSVVLCAPTGAGKGLMQSCIANLLMGAGLGGIIYNSRRTLTDQSYDRLVEDGIHCGVRAASRKELQNLHAKFQVGSMQTDIARIINQGVWNIHDCAMAIIDEAHLSATGKSVELIQAYLAAGVKIVGVTGTPIGLSSVYKDIVVAGTNSELRKCKAHVPAKVFGVHEMDTSQIKLEKTGEFSDGAIRRECWSQAIVGHIYADYKKLNPDGRPAMAAAPGIGESVWLAEQFLAKGHRVVHIDCNEVVVGKERFKNDPQGKVRAQVLDEFRQGKFELLSNCEVIQQGVDLPNLYHLILARPYGSLANYAQTCGRVIRYSEETPDYVIVQDHGGNWWRHGSPNEDRDWAKLFEMNEKEIKEERDRNINEEKVREPITCPTCGAVRNEGARCHNCGHISDKRVREIVQKDGQLIEMTGRIYTPPKEKVQKPIHQKQWENVFWPSKNSKSPRAMTFTTAFELYRKKHGEYPPPGTKYTPKDKSDMGRRIRDVDWSELQ